MNIITMKTTSMWNEWEVVYCIAWAWNYNAISYKRFCHQVVKVWMYIVSLPWFFIPWNLGIQIIIMKIWKYYSTIWRFPTTHWNFRTWLHWVEHGKIHAWINFDLCSPCSLLSKIVISCDEVITIDN